VNKKTIAFHLTEDEAKMVEDALMARGLEIGAGAYYAKKAALLDMCSRGGHRPVNPEADNRAPSS
jgi:hypothetical protein